MKLIHSINLLACFLIIACDSDSNSPNTSLDRPFVMPTPEQLVTEELKLSGQLVINTDDDCEIPDSYEPIVELKGFTRTGQPFAGFTKARFKEKINEDKYYEYDIIYQGFILDEAGLNKAKANAYSDLQLCATLPTLEVAGSLLTAPVTGVVGIIPFTNGVMNIAICFEQLEGSLEALEARAGGLIIDQGTVEVRGYIANNEQILYPTEWKSLNQFQIQQFNDQVRFGFVADSNEAPHLIIDIPCDPVPPGTGTGNGGNDA